MYDANTEQNDSSNLTSPKLDTALNDLGILSSHTTARRGYLREKRLNMVINPKFVSNVSIGFRLRHVAPSNRYVPYNVPRREERHRTRSENNDSNDSTSLVKAIIETTVEPVDELSQLKKAKSLESIIGECSDVDLKNFQLPEVEIVSNCIEKLRVDDR